MRIVLKILCVRAFHMHVCVNFSSMWLSLVLCMYVRSNSEECPSRPLMAQRPLQWNWGYFMCQFLLESTWESLKASTHIETHTHTHTLILFSEWMMHTHTHTCMCFLKLSSRHCINHPGVHSAVCQKTMDTYIHKYLSQRAVSPVDTHRQSDRVKDSAWSQYVTSTVDDDQHSCPSK